MNEQDEREDSRLLRCPLCDSEKFIWGIARSGNHSLNFVAGETFFEQIQNLLPKKVKARCCAHCGNLQLFIRD